MRFLLIPQTIDLLPGAKDPHAFVRFIDETLASDARWFSDASWEDAFDQITDKIAALKGDAVGSVLALSDAEHEKLEKVVREYPYTPSVKKLVKPYVRAITKAFTKDPRPTIEAVPETVFNDT